MSKKIPCEHGYTSKRSCKTCEAIRGKNRYKLDPDNEISRASSYYQEHKEERRAYARERYRKYYSADPAAVKQQHVKPIPSPEERLLIRQKYYSRGRSVNSHILTSNNGRAKKYGVEGVITLDDVNRMKSGSCYYCGATQFPIEIDHIIPMSAGGSNHPENVVGACKFCNKAKHDYPLEDFRVWLDWIRKS